jgi:hypothetical protein
MKTTRALLVSVFALTALSATAVAKPLVDNTAPIVPLPKAATLADNVVVTPSTTTPAPQAQPQPVQPVAPAQPVVVDPEPPRRQIVQEDVTPPHNYVATVAVSALMGALAGGLIGGAVYYLDHETHPANIAYWAAGGVLVGTGVGVVQIAVQESRASAAVANQAPTDPARTYRLALLRVHF